MCGLEYIQESTNGVMVMDKKLTDKEIVKALEWCEQFTDNLVMANVDTKKRTLGLQVMQTCKSALDLINRLQARVEKCEKVEHFADKTIATLQAENERKDKIYIELLKTSSERADIISSLKAENERLKKENHWFADIGKLYSEIKAEAYKECIDKIQNQIKNNSVISAEWLREYLDNLLKMDGEDK